ncbi:MAG: class I SAM-dependent methyltransferase [Ignavibacteriaceae bacterium]|jgi:ubiquinone/menaquinone biosynthesis C-methylase UbiE|nr:class I SAM-dependent methyltransferase [Ignavibacteriaceae bacterium]MCW8813544.1 class I SAM-dependent methyltransferase [Chlorobium sp.]MCW8995310.1 class I SAM-dependent methyltransferase [Psychromonas sp.]MCW8823525.1 class I SAM-dependent methyltransferase [Ignavibacteriaceae bacterium]MCW8960303.1 class I SAM-dependent methyltransferase [Ignavibacteriaceae bacterium]
MTSDSLQINNVNKAFTRQSKYYDDYDKQNSTLTWMRQQVRKHVLKYLRPNDKILELNSGTGLDAEFFAQKGFLVHCTDLSDGMVEQMKEKFTSGNFSDKITIQQCSFTELDKIGNRKYDFIFSNFGGLNCIPDLRESTKYFPSLLNKNGRVSLVILPPVCPWELIQLFRGKIKFAFRRFNKGGTMANVEGVKFKTYYFSAPNVMRSLGNDFKLLKLESLAVFTPIPQMEKIPKKFPSLAKVLNKIDERISGVFPFNRIGDHIIVTAEYIVKD